MPEKIVQLNEEVIKGQLKELVREFRCRLNASPNRGDLNTQRHKKSSF